MDGCEGHIHDQLQQVNQRHNIVEEAQSQDGCQTEGSILDNAQTPALNCMPSA